MSIFLVQYLFRNFLELEKTAYCQLILSHLLTKLDSFSHPPLQIGMSMWLIFLQSKVRGIDVNNF